MKIVISPAKSLDFETPMPTGRHTQPLFLDQAEKLNKVLAKKKPRALSKLMGISDNLAELNWQRNQEFSRPFTACSNCITRHPGFSFTKRCTTWIV